jgi:hypothetical protein
MIAAGFAMIIGAVKAAPRRVGLNSAR